MNADTDRSRSTNRTMLNHYHHRSHSLTTIASWERNRIKLPRVYAVILVSIGILFGTCPTTVWGEPHGGDSHYDSESIYSHNTSLHTRPPYVNASLSSSSSSSSSSRRAPPHMLTAQDDIAVTESDRRNTNIMRLIQRRGREDESSYPSTHSGRSRLRSKSQSSESGSESDSEKKKDSSAANHRQTIGPVELNGKIVFESSNQEHAAMGNYSYHTIMNPLNPTQPLRIGHLASPGLRIDFSSIDHDHCLFLLCSSKLIRPPSDWRSWNESHKTELASNERYASLTHHSEQWQQLTTAPTVSSMTMRSQVCHTFMNMTNDHRYRHHAESESPTTSITSMIPPGIQHFAIFAQPANINRQDRSKSSTRSCHYSLTVSGTACLDGYVGDNCDIPPPVSLAVSNSPFNLVILPPSDDSHSNSDSDHTDSGSKIHGELEDDVVFVEIHSRSIYTRSIVVNITSSHHNFSLVAAPHFAPTAERIMTTLPAHFNQSLHSNNLLVSIDLPAYRIMEEDERYYIGLKPHANKFNSSPSSSSLSSSSHSNSDSRSNSRSDSASSPSVLSLRLSELECPPGYHGRGCEYFVEHYLDPFDLRAYGRNIIYRSSYQWNMAHTEIWFYFALIFLNIRPSQDFSIGLASLDGQQLPHLYLRMGNIPTLHQWDVRLTATSRAEGQHFYESGTTILHDAIWYVGVNVPTSYTSIGDIGLWFNSPCPGDSSRLQMDGSTIVSECGSHGVCNVHAHVCECDEGYAGIDCMMLDTSLGLSSTTRAIIGLILVLACVGFGYLLHWFFSSNRYQQPIVRWNTSRSISAPASASSSSVRYARIRPHADDDHPQSLPNNGNEI